ncbi:hypothetical protein V8F33_012711 [Rhypophila sp. PSN 637]
MYQGDKRGLLDHYRCLVLLLVLKQSVQPNKKSSSASISTTPRIEFCTLLFPLGVTESGGVGNGVAEGTSETRRGRLRDCNGLRLSAQKKLTGAWCSVEPPKQSLQNPDEFPLLGLYGTGGPDSVVSRLPNKRRQRPGTPVPYEITGVPPPSGISVRPLDGLPYCGFGVVMLDHLGPNEQLVVLETAHEAGGRCRGRGLRGGDELFVGDV